MEDVAKLGGDIFNEDWLDDEKVELETREEGDAEKGDSARPSFPEAHRRSRSARGQPCSQRSSRLDPHLDSCD